MPITADFIFGSEEKVMLFETLYQLPLAIDEWLAKEKQGLSRIYGK